MAKAGVAGAVEDGDHLVELLETTWSAISLNGCWCCCGALDGVAPEIEETKSSRSQRSAVVGSWMSS